MKNNNFKKILCSILSVCAVATAFSSCATTGSSSSQATQPTTQEIETTQPTTAEETQEGSTAPSGDDISDFPVAPASYRSEANESGTLEHFSYTTKNYSSTKETVESGAYVYLPYGYDESDTSKKYNILYLMHGAGGDENGYLGTSDSPSELKYILDNSIENKDFDPMIVVAVTINCEGDDTAYYTGMDNFRTELSADILPSVEGKYHTYAENTTNDGLKASRGHRAFGGFSMGGYVAMTTFLDDLDYFEYFMPMGAYYSYHEGNPDAEGSGDVFAQAAKDSGYSPDQYYMFTAAGSKDFLCAGMYNQVKAMATHTDEFKYTKNSFDNGNLLFYMIDGNEHGSGYSYDYIYNGLKLFYKK